MAQEPGSYFASFGHLELRTSKARDGYLWTVKNPNIGAEITHGEAADLASAMIAAAEAVGAEWGTVRWRSPEDES